MRKLSSTSDIWELAPSIEDFRQGAIYAALTLPWTFNRMMLNSSSWGQQSRALNIAKGIAGQEVLKRELNRVGVPARAQRKSHRDDDLFDLESEIEGRPTKIDLKSIHYFTDYDSLGREPFSTDLLIKNMAYSGPDWRLFFPMLVPHTQIAQDKEVYCFAIASSVDPRQDVFAGREEHALTAFPYGKHLEFLSSKKLCLRREETSNGFAIELLYRHDSLFDTELNIAVIGEWAGKPCLHDLRVRSGRPTEVGPFSCVTSFQIDHGSYLRLDGSVKVSVVSNDFTAPVLNSSKRNINSYPEECFQITKNDFCNLRLPTDYRLYVIGWIYKNEFIEACRQYSGWVWPNDKDNRFKNQAWRQITERDRSTLTTRGFGDVLNDDTDILSAGWLKTTGHGGGACCYVFPNLGSGGGVKETNLYVLAKDLYTMDSLIDQSENFHD